MTAKAQPQEVNRFSTNVKRSFVNYTLVKLMSKTNNLQKQLSDLAASLGIDYFGVADLAVAKDFICRTRAATRLHVFHSYFDRYTVG